jgi:hypothetical protein
MPQTAAVIHPAAKKLLMAGSLLLNKAQPDYSWFLNFG